ncbi:MAG: hypothetical protein IIA45_06045 [Bacteroidetes bacterium]|nr:hypothetical protein [Bacteroidota bacterium]
MKDSYKISEFLSIDRILHVDNNNRMYLLTTPPIFPGFFTMLETGIGNNNYRIISSFDRNGVLEDTVRIVYEQEYYVKKVLSNQNYLFFHLVEKKISFFADSIPEEFISVYDLKGKILTQPVLVRAGINNESTKSHGARVSFNNDSTKIVYSFFTSSFSGPTEFTFKLFDHELNNIWIKNITIDKPKSAINIKCLFRCLCVDKNDNLIVLVPQIKKPKARGRKAVKHDFVIYSQLAASSITRQCLIPNGNRFLKEIATKRFAGEYLVIGLYSYLRKPFFAGIMFAEFDVNNSEFNKAIFAAVPTDLIYKTSGKLKRKAKEIELSSIVNVIRKDGNLVLILERNLGLESPDFSSLPTGYYFSPIFSQKPSPMSPTMPVDRAQHGLGWSTSIASPPSNPESYEIIILNFNSSYQLGWWHVLQKSQTSRYQFKHVLSHSMVIRNDKLIFVYHVINSDKSKRRKVKKDRIYNRYVSVKLKISTINMRNGQIEHTYLKNFYKGWGTMKLTLNILDSKGTFYIAKNRVGNKYRIVRLELD